MTRTIKIKLSDFQFDYLQDALSLLANYRPQGNRTSDAIGQRLVDGWNKAASTGSQKKTKEQR